MLIDRVRQFQDTGVHERIGNMGNDAIGVLANALDAGFAAIANRMREREEFFSIAAHELKTPLTSIQGYSSLVMSRPEAGPLLFRALEVINRQSWRMSRSSMACCSLYGLVPTSARSSYRSRYQFASISAPKPAEGNVLGTGHRLESGNSC
jgi:hypothetical protein